MGRMLERRLWGAGVVVLAAVLTVLAARRLDKPTEENAPEYRQKGPQDACVVIAEFSDFQCPACKQAEAGIKKLLDLYGQNTRFLFKQFPLPARVHPWAKAAAIASECAGRQGKFWLYHDLLYERQGEWSEAKEPPEELVKLGRKAGLDEPALRACMKDPTASAVVEADVKEGENRWVGSTPTFFINHRRFAGSQQFATLGTVWIDKILKTCQKPSTR